MAINVRVPHKSKELYQISKYKLFKKCLSFRMQYQVLLKNRCFHSATTITGNIPCPAHRHKYYYSSVATLCSLALPGWWRNSFQLCGKCSAAAISSLELKTWKLGVASLYRSENISVDTGGKNCQSQSRATGNALGKHVTVGQCSLRRIALSAD
jgi:hypothetical protein